MNTTLKHRKPVLDHEKLLRHARRAEKVTGRKAANVWAMRALEEALVKKDFTSAGKIAGEFKIDKADEAINRAANRIPFRGRRIIFGTTIQKRFAFICAAEDAIYGKSPTREKAMPI